MKKILIALFTLAVCILPGRTAAQISRNPILPGFHADPEILYSNKDNKYYIYSTTDGVPGWGGYYYHAFSAPTIDGPWTDCGVVLDAKSEQVPWADGNLWAPAAIERKEGDSYKYYLYFSANNPESRRKEISVAVADDPAGPFVALDRPMIKDDPSRRGQQIDVDVFQDPVSGKYYLYWGNGFMAGAELNDDLSSIKEETITLLTPKGGTLQDYAFREGAYVFYRNGKYYFMWSVDDTGSPNYHVAYGTSDSPLGPITVADPCVVLIQNPEKEIYGPAHHSVINVPGTDDWYIVYHRINKNYLDKSMGPGYHREVCIDRMYFNEDGSIKPVVPTTAPEQALHPGYPINPVLFTSVKVNDGFWGKRLETGRNVTIPLAFSKCEESGRYDNFVKAANPSDEYKVGGFPFDDTDVYKTIEGASYMLQTYPDKKLEAYIDSVLEIVAKAQEKDGYLNTSYTMNPKHPHPWMSPVKWEKVENLSHEFYNLGHMVEGAVAHYQATGKRNFLNIAMKYADCVVRNLGTGYNQVDRVPGHQIAEMALAKLYLVTGEKRYLDQAKYFLDRRGKTSRKDAYSQAHKPVVEQDEAVGHAVRAAYMYSGMADVAALTGDTAYINAIDRIWDNIVSKKYYITGGIGARHAGEAFGDNYELPNLSAYNETCAAIGNVYLNHRLFLLHGDAKYYDVLERTLYNGLISGVSLDGNSFFYPNPLECNGEYHFNADNTIERQPWFGCACCPSNISRFIPSLPGYVYATKGSDVFVNLFMGNTSEFEVNGSPLKISQSGNYTWDGNVTISVDNNPGSFSMKIRIPGWAQGNPVPSDLYTYTNTVKDKPYTVKLNGKEVESTLDKGYFTITRDWKQGDKVDIQFAMNPRIVKAHDAVEADRGMVAVERGPIVYCAEWPDNNFDLNDVKLNTKNKFKAGRDESLGGFIRLTNKTHSLIPYYAWNHRGPGMMKVCMPETK